MYRFLIVDDEAIEREGVQFLLNKFGYSFEVFTRNNGRTALEFLKETPVDILCTDIKMPFMDGLELCEAAKRLYPNLCCVLLTAYSDFEYAKRAIHVGADDYLLKPVIAREFKELIDKLIAKLDERQKEEDDRRHLISRYKDADEELRKQLMDSLILQMKHEVRNNADTFLFSSNQLVRNAAEIINREYASDVTLESIAARLQVSKGYLSTLFKEETGVSVMQYITLMRMNRAEHLLRNTSMKINEVAEAAGYHDASYFGMQFKKIYGMSPFQYRNREGK